MISKNAHNLYELSRQVEQADSMLRLLSSQLKQLPKDSSQTLAIGWEWIFKSLQVQAPSGLLLAEDKEESSDFCQADAYTLIDYFTFEKGHEHSILSCFQSAQQQARNINSPVTKALDSICLMLNSTPMKEIWLQKKTLDFYKKLQISVALLRHSFDNNFYRGEDFYFIKLGQFIEHFKLTVSILNVHAQYIIGWKEQEKELNNLLSYCGAFNLYQQAFGSEKNIQKVFDFIVSDLRSPSSLLFSLNQIETSIQNINLNSPLSKTLYETIQSLKDKIMSSHQSALIPFLEFIQRQFQILQKELNFVYFQHSDFYAKEFKKHG